MKNSKLNTIIANYGASIVSIAAPIIALPFYVKILGMSNWGLLSFFMFAQTLAQMFEAGWGQALVREISSKIGIDGDVLDEYIKVVEKIYLCAAIFFALASFFAMKSFSEKWSGEDGSWTIVIVTAMQVAVVFPNSLYRAILISKDKQIKLSYCSMAVIIFRHGFSVVLVRIFPSPVTVMMVFLLAALIEVFFRKFMCGNKVISNASVNHGAYIDAMKRLSKISIPILIGIVATQSDKIIVGYFMSTEDFGVYAIASTVAAGLTQVAYPVLQAYVPLLVKFHNSKLELSLINKKLFKILSIQAAFIGCAYFAVGERIIVFWLNGVDSDRVISVLNILIFGTFLNFFYNVGYNNWIAKFEPRKILISNIISIALLVGVSPLMISNYGVNGAGCGWIIVNAVGIVIYLIMRGK